MQINKIHSVTLKIYLFKPLISSMPPPLAPLLPSFFFFSLKNFSTWHHFGASIASKLGCTILKNKKYFTQTYFLCQLPLPQRTKSVLIINRAQLQRSLTGYLKRSMVFFNE